MTNSWMNEDGEPIMDGAAWRYEQQLDAEYAAERAYVMDDSDGWDDEPDETHTECDECTDGWVNRTTGICDDCGFDFTDEGDPMEDQWLDGSYEE